MKNIINLVLSFLFVFQCHSGFAEDLLISAGSEEGALFQFPVWYRMRAYKLDSFPLDSKETFNSQQVFFRHQLRFSPSISFEKDLRIIFEADAFSGLIAGDKDKNTGDYLLLPEDEYTGRGRFDLRKAYISWKMDAGVLRFGQQASNFGLGLIANSGDGEDDWFSDNGLGDISERFMFITTPLIIFSNSDWAKSVYLAFGADLVYRDDNADLMDGDTAYQGVASLMYNTEDIKAGFYLAVRRQEDDKGTILNANAYDLYFDFKKNLTDQLSFSAGFEGAVISGYTDRVISYGARKGLDILSAGAVLKTGIAHKGLSLNFDALFGYASGDNNPSDSETRAFFFDPDFKAGMILFEEVLARATARTTEIVTDPELMGYPPIGVSAIPTDGSITNAFFIK
ncbi:MAG: hypothetical protein FJ088_08820, partial [Deltaproteobacteria bacterium]|nr:hypothetical protein [Deltaproteobacteria bacterium]